MPSRIARETNRNIRSLLFHRKGSSNGHSPVLNLSKSGGIDQGSTGDQSDRSENASPAPSMRDEDENLSEDNLSEVDERGAKDDGNLPLKIVYLFDNYEWAINLLHRKIKRHKTPNKSKLNQFKSINVLNTFSSTFLRRCCLFIALVSPPPSPSTPLAIRPDQI